MSDRPAPMTEAEHRLLSHFLSPGTRVTERTMVAVHAYRDEVLRKAAAKQRAYSCCEFDGGCSGNCGGILADLIDPDVS